MQKRSGEETDQDKNRFMKGLSVISAKTSLMHQMFLYSDEETHWDTLLEQWFVAGSS